MAKLTRHVSKSSARDEVGGELIGQQSLLEFGSHGSDSGRPVIGSRLLVSVHIANSVPEK